MELSKLKFTKTHEWVSPEGSVGISDHAQKEITDVVFVELPASGKSLKAGEEAGTIESVKAAFPIYAPVSGKVSQVNPELSSNPALVNQSPYEKGWILKLEISDSGELAKLMDHDQYQEFLKTEPSH